MALISNKPQKNTESRLIGILVLVGLLSYLSYLSLPGLLEQYSFWRDEIFTAAFISGSWVELFRDWIGPDVHPPLYFIITKIWSDLLGTSELSLRGFSFLVSVLTIVLLWHDWRKSNRTQRLIALLYIASNPTFLYYSQEARSYSLILFLSCYLLLRISNHRDETKSDRAKEKPNPYITYCLCLALSLTHYFGFILSFFILAIDCWDHSIHSRRCASAIAIIIISIWPAFHIGFLGELGGVQQEKLSNLTGTFTPIFSTLGAYIYSSLYIINSGIRALNIIIITTLITLALRYLRYANNFRDGALNRSYSEFIYSAILICLIVFSLSILELYWPITTARNFIILLYPTAILIGSIYESCILNIKSTEADKKFLKLFSLATLSAILLLSNKISTNNLYQKVNHGIDYKSLSSHLKKTNLCESGCLTLDYDPDGIIFGDKIDDYYFGEFMLTSYAKAEKLKPEDLKLFPIIGSTLDKSKIKEFATLFPSRTLITSCSDDQRADQPTPFILTVPNDDGDVLCIADKKG